MRAYFLLWLSFATQLAAQTPNEHVASLKTIRANGVELHYVDQGTGTPVIFIHGGLADYREWNAQLSRFSERHRVIAYSRRYNYPNNNSQVGAAHSAIVEAEDLAALLDNLNLERVHLVGYSYGAFTALRCATLHPERVRTLTLAEPPVLSWLRDTPGNAVEFERFMNALWKPVADAFGRNDADSALRITCDYFSGKDSYDAIPSEARRMFHQNLKEWKALTTSRDAFPPLDRDTLRNLKMPIRLLTGDKTLTPLRLIMDELTRLVPHAEKVTIPNATHDLWIEKPDECGNAVADFLDRHP